MAKEIFLNSIDFLSNLTVEGSLSAAAFESSDSPKWNSVYTTVSEASADWNIDIDTEVRALTGNYSSVYTTVQLNSAAWAAAAVYIKKYDYVSDGVDYSYSGLAANGTLETDPVWTVTRLIFSDVGALSASGVAQNITWTERLTATYI